MRKEFGNLVPENTFSFVAVMYYRTYLLDCSDNAINYDERKQFVDTNSRR